MSNVIIITTFLFLLVKNFLGHLSEGKGIPAAIKRAFAHSLFELIYVSTLYLLAGFYLGTLLAAYFDSKLFIDLSIFTFYLLSFIFYKYLDKKGLIDAELSKSEKDNALYTNRKYLKNDLARTGLKEAFFVGILYLALTFLVFVVGLVLGGP